MKHISPLLFSSAVAASGLSYHPETTIAWSPKNVTSVDQSLVFNGTYFLSDRNNFGVEVIDLATNKRITTITGFQGLPIVNSKPDIDIAGPNGLVALPNRNELYAGDGDGTVRVVDLSTYTIVANISTGAQERADESAYDPQTQTVVITNPNENPPYVSIISAQTRTVLGRIQFPGADDLEQPIYNPANGRFYVSVPNTDANPGGEIAELDLSAMNISRVIPLPSCNPAGIVLGPNQNVFVGCSQDQILNYGVAFSVVVNISTGDVVANISGLSGIDQVAYDSNAMLYFASAYQNLAGGTKSGDPTPQLGIIDAKTNTLIQTLATDNATAHSVAVDSQSNKLLVPVSKFGIEVYTLTTVNGTNITPSTTGHPATSSTADAATNAGVTTHTNSLVMLISALALGILFW